jgi:hypothetical protein
MRSINAALIFGLVYRFRPSGRSAYGVTGRIVGSAGICNTSIAGAANHDRE